MTERKKMTLDDLIAHLAEDLLDPEATSMEEIEEELRRAGLDPKKVGERGQELVDRLMRDRKKA